MAIPPSTKLLGILAMNVMKSLIKPKAIGPGDVIGLVSPSGPVTHMDRFEGGIASLREVGFNVVLGKNALKKHYHMAGSDEERSEDINEMFKDPNVKGIVTTTGGYSSSRILDLIDYDLIKRNPKVFVGISDITVLLNAIHEKTGLVTFHGPYLVYGICGMSDYVKRNLMKVVATPSEIGNLEQLTEWESLKGGNASGRLLGGNSSSVRNLIGTEYEPDWNGSILFLEAFMKEPHYLDREFTHFRQCGIFNKINGLVVGKLNKCIENEFKDDPMDLREMILEQCKGYNFPIIYVVDFGHACENLTLPVGIEVHMDTHTKKLNINQSA